MGQHRPLYHLFSVFLISVQLKQRKMSNWSFYYLARGFEPMTSWTWVSSHNHWTRAPTMVHFRSIVGLYLNKVVPDKFRVDKVTLNTVVQWREPWYSGYGRRLTWQRSWVRILAPYTGYLFEKTENKRKRGPGWPILKNKQMVLDELALNTITPTKGNVQNGNINIGNQQIGII